MEQKWWGEIRDELSKSPSKSYIALALTILVGAIASGLVTAISSAGVLMHIFLVVGFGVVVIIVFLAYFIVPYWKFKWKYGFLEDEENETARKLIEIRNKAEKARNLVDGIIAIQLFKVERHTTDSSIIVRFNKLFSIESEGPDISTLKDRTVEIPIKLLEWILNPRQPAPDFGDFLNGYVYEYLLQRSGNRNAQLLSIINNWDVQIPEKFRITGIHFNTIFNFTRILESGDLHNYKIATNSNLMHILSYNGKRSKHKERVYYTLRLGVSIIMCK